MRDCGSGFGVCVINLDTSLGRCEAMKAEFAKAGLPWRRVPGVRATAVPDHLRPFFTDASEGPVPSLTPGEIGCFAAHLSIMAGMVAGDFEPVMLVFEDDCSLLPGLKEHVSELIRTLPADWDMVRLCNVPKRAYLELDRLTSGHAVIRYSVIPNFSGAYLVSLVGARKLLTAGPRTIPFDGYLREAWRHGSNVFGVWPPMVVQNEGESCIDRIDENLDTGRGGLSDRSARATAGRRLAWKIGVLGCPAWIGCGIVSAADAVQRRFTRRTLIHHAAPWLGALGGRGSAACDRNNGAVRGPTVGYGLRLEAKEA